MSKNLKYLEVYRLISVQHCCSCISDGVAVAPEASFLQSLRGLHKKTPQACGLRGFAMKEMKFLNQRTQSEVDLCADRDNALFVSCARCTCSSS